VLGFPYVKKSIPAGRQWLTPVILATQEAEIRRTKVLSSPGKKFERPYLEKTDHKKGWWSDSRCRLISSPSATKKKKKKNPFLPYIILKTQSKTALKTYIGKTDLKKTKPRTTTTTNFKTTLRNVWVEDDFLNPPGRRHEKDRLRGLESSCCHQQQCDIVYAAQSSLYGHIFYFLWCWGLHPRPVHAWQAYYH
jgi:hypothetical protein